jgi:hypothetical protein
MYFARLLFHIHETPKYLLGKAKDREATEVIQSIAMRDVTTTWLTVDHFHSASARLQNSEADELVSADSSPEPDNIIRRAVKAWAPHRMMALSTSMMLFL